MDIPGSISRFRGQVVGEDLVIIVDVVDNPHRSAVRPDASWAAVPRGAQGVEVLGRIPCLCGQVIRISLRVSPVSHPHGRAVRPDASGVGVATYRAVSRDRQGVEVFGFVPCLCGQIVREYLGHGGVIVVVVGGNRGPPVAGRCVPRHGERALPPITDRILGAPGKPTSDRGGLL